MDLGVIGLIDMNSNIVCPFNGWKYDTNGVLAAIGSRGMIFKKTFTNLQFKNKQIKNK